MAEVNINTDETIIKILFLDNNQKDEDQDFKHLSTLILENFADVDGKLKRIPYEIIASYVYNSTELYDEGNEFLYKNLEKLVGATDDESVNSITKFKDKVESHYKLCKEQKEYIQNNILSLNSEIKSAKKTITDTVQETEKVNKDIINTKNKMYTEFVAILGIFSALMFGMISGFDLISDSLALLASEQISVGRIAIGSSTLAISLITLMYTLVQWVGHLIKNPFRPESFNEKSPRNKGIAGFEYRHSLFLLAIYMLLNILFLGVILVISSNSGFHEAVYNGSFSFNLIFRQKLFATLAIVANIGIIAFIDLYLIGNRLFSKEIEIQKNNPPSQ